MNTLWLGQGRETIEPVRLVLDAPGGEIAAGAGGGAWWAWALVAAAVVVATALLVRWVARARSNARDPARGAFEALARRLRLTRGERELLVSLGGEGGVKGAHPAALLLSRASFARCADAGVRARAPWAEPVALAELHAKIFRA